MRDNNDPNYNKHKAGHRLFNSKIQEFWHTLKTNPLLVQIDMLIFLKNWLINHIIEVDSKLCALVKN